MSAQGQEPAWGRIVREMMERSTETAPTEPGVYRMPCGECIVDFFVTADGEEHWLLPGDARSYTRETVATARHGDHPWERLYTLGEAAAELQRLAAALIDLPDDRVERVAAMLDDHQIARIVRERADMPETPLGDVARRFGVDHDVL